MSTCDCDSSCRAVEDEPCHPWVVGEINTPVGSVPVVAAVLDRGDLRGSWKARWAINRMRYVITPGLYAVGAPTACSPVLVSANYKMSFDCLRRELSELDAWILVLDTKGINVWCAAGKGTFGTEVLVSAIHDARLSEVVTHRSVILPQLGAPGVAAHEVRSKTGFTVVYGPVRAADLRVFLSGGLCATPAMRAVMFGFWDRVVLIPVQVRSCLKYLALAMVYVALWSGWTRQGFSLPVFQAVWVQSLVMLASAMLAGSVVVPACLPWIPFRAFSAKGVIAGLLLFGMLLAGVPCLARLNVLDWMAWCLMVPAVASFLAMDFTGCSTFTSLSGVRKEMRRAVPVQIGAFVVGHLLWIMGRFVG